MLKKEIGHWGAIRAILVLALFQRKLVVGQSLMDGIGVSPKMRGSGIGTKLLFGLIGYAQEEGYRSVRLDVIDKNLAAQRLYECVGFVPFKAEGIVYLRWPLGFAVTTQMEYSLNAEA